MSPTLSLQIYAEPFVSAGEYTNYKELVDGRAEDFAVTLRADAHTGNADFNFRSFRTTNVLRWGTAPADFFVVWQQGREENESFGKFRFSRDFGGVFRRASQQRLPREVLALAELLAISQHISR